MFEDLAKYRNIIISGPTRTGSTIATAMIAQDTGFRYVKEANTLERARKVMEMPGHVVQCVGCVTHVEKLPTDEDLVVFMWRPPQEIRDSWGTLRIRQGAPKGSKRTNLREIEEFYGAADPALIYSHWIDVQRPLIKNTWDLSYYDLVNHPLWVDKQDRLDWKFNQINAENTHPSDVNLEVPRDAFRSE